MSVCGANAFGDVGAPVPFEGGEETSLLDAVNVFGIEAAVTLICIPLFNNGVPVNNKAVFAWSGSVNSTIQYLVSDPKAGLE